MITAYGWGDDMANDNKTGDNDSIEISWLPADSDAQPIPGTTDTLLTAYEIAMKLQNGEMTDAGREATSGPHIEKCG